MNLNLGAIPSSLEIEIESDLLVYLHFELERSILAIGNIISQSLQGSRPIAKFS
jgi:hypothetical protein